MSDNRQLQRGDYVLVQAGQIHAVGMVGVGAAEILGRPQPGFVPLDVCLMSQHLPQNYGIRECTLLDDVDLESHGLCVTCKGWGVPDPSFEGASVDDLIDGRTGAPCADCGGSGRRGISVIVTRAPSVTEGHIGMDPDARSGVTCPMCALAYG